MAVLSKHGVELCRVHGLTSDVSYRSDGQIMRNYGNGWKLWKRIKPGLDPVEVAKKAHERFLHGNDDMPARAALEKWVHENCPLSHRWRLVETVKSMPDDCDGVWSSFDDDYSANGLRGRFSFEDCAEICRLYKAALAEVNEKNNPIEA